MVIRQRSCGATVVVKDKACLSTYPAVVPDNPNENEGGGAITSSDDGEVVRFELSGYKRINTLRSTLDDLLTHLEQAKKVWEYSEGKNT